MTVKWSTQSGDCEGTTGAASANIIIDGNGESNESLGDGGQENDRNTGVPRLDVDAASADNKVGRTIGPASSEAGRASTLEEAGTGAGRPFLE